jgi:hypothetical protein
MLGPCSKREGARLAGGAGLVEIAKRRAHIVAPMIHGTNSASP